MKIMLFRSDDGCGKAIMVLFILYKNNNDLTSIVAIRYKKRVRAWLHKTVFELFTTNTFNNILKCDKKIPNNI